MFLATTGARAIVVCGVGGAYPSDPAFMLATWSCAETECYGDLGATSPSGFLDMKALGFPVVEAPVPLFNELPMQLFPVERRVPFVTVSSLHRHRRAPHAPSKREPRGAVESMEGAAIAHVAHLHSVPVGEVRGISNIVTESRHQHVALERGRRRGTGSRALVDRAAAELRLLALSERHLRVSRAGARPRAWTRASFPTSTTWKRSTRAPSAAKRR